MSIAPGEGRKRFQLLWAAHPGWTFVETAGLGLLILFLLSRVLDNAPQSVFGNGLLMLCGACGTWMALRTRVPQLQPGWQVLWELAVGVALSLWMALGLRLITNLLGWSGVWAATGLGDFLISVLGVLKLL